MKIVNHTQYNTKQLKAVAMRVAQDELNPEQRKLVVIHFHYKRQHGNRADRFGRRVETKHLKQWNLSKVGLRYNSFCVNVHRRASRIERDYVGVQLAHEMAECRGLRHKDMRHPRYGYKGHLGLPYGTPWCNILDAVSFPIDVRQKKEKPARPVQLQRKLDQAQGKVSAWERKARLAATKVRAWSNRAKVLQRRLALESAPSAHTG